MWVLVGPLLSILTDRSVAIFALDVTDEEIRRARTLGRTRVGKPQDLVRSSSATDCAVKVIRVTGPLLVSL